jgi:hypothetical protein
VIDEKKPKTVTTEEDSGPFEENDDGLGVEIARIGFEVSLAVLPIVLFCVKLNAVPGLVSAPKPLLRYRSSPARTVVQWREVI